MADVTIEATPNGPYLYPGRWEVAVNHYNPNAVLFWRSAVRALPASEFEERPGDGMPRTGAVLRFAVASPS